MTFLIFLYFLIPKYSSFHAQQINITYYNTGKITASGITPYSGSIAISRDLLQNFKIGEIVYLSCKDCPFEGYYQIEDKTSKKLQKTVDIYIKNKNLTFQEGKWKGILFKIVNTIK